jgi:hypothetical protein
MAAKFFFTPLFAVLLVGITAFTCPGMFGALNGLGAGGNLTATTSNIANAVTFGMIALFSFLVGRASITEKSRGLNLATDVGSYIQPLLIVSVLDGA